MEDKKLYKNLLLSVLIFGMFFISITNVSALLDVKGFNKDIGEYGQVEIDYLLFLNKVDYRLTDYGNSVIDAWAEGEYTLHKRAHLFTGISYKDILGNNGNFKNNRFYIWNEENETRYNPIYENQNCYLDFNLTDEELLYPEMLINESAIEKCDSILISNDSCQIDISGWIPYAEGTKIEKGEGKWRVETEKPSNQKVDFILEGHGEDFTEWAWWNSTWSYKRELSNLTGDISYLEINRTNNMFNFPNEIRFLDNTDSIELNYTIEKELDGDGYSYDSFNSGLKTDLISYYKLDENAASTTVDDAHGSNDGTASTNTNNLYDASGKINSAFDFNGTDDYVDIDDAGGVGTIESYGLWFKTSSTENYKILLSRGNNAEAYTFLSLGINLGKLMIQTRGSTDGVISDTSTNSYNDGNWHFIVLKYNNRDVSAIIDNSETVSVVAPVNFDVTSFDYLTIGCLRKDTTAITSQFFDGLIDEVGIWSRALNSTEVSKLYNSTKAQFRVNNLGEDSIDMYYGNDAVSTTSSASDTYFEPVSMYYLDDNANDFVGSNDGTVNGATLSSGYINGSYDFDGSDDYIDLNSDLGMNGKNKISVSFWIYPNDLTNNYGGLFTEDQDDATDFSIRSPTGTNDVTALINGISVTSTDDCLSDNTWSHIVTTYDSAKFYLYVDNDLKDSADLTSSLDITGNLVIGQDRGLSRYFDGKIDEVGIYDYALSSTQIEALYNQTAPTYTLGSEETLSNPPTITANSTKPDIVYPDTDYLVNLTIEDTDVGDTLTGYVQFYINGTATSTEQSTVVTNGTNTLIGTLSSGNFTGGDILIAQVWSGDGTVNTTKVNLTSSEVAHSPLITNLVEYPSDPATFSESTIYRFNATVTDIGTLDDVILDFNGINYTATNISSDIFSASVTNLSVGIYNYSWFANNSIGGINNSETGSYTVNQATSQTSLTFNIPSPQTYSTPVTPTCSAIYGDGEVVLEMDGSTITSGAAIIIGAGTRTFNCSYAETANYTGSQNISSYIINKAIPAGSLTSSIGWTINETQEVTIGLSEGNPNDGDVTYIIYRDNVAKGTGETWSPSYGIYNYILNTTGGANWTVNSSMDIETLSVGDNINPNIEIVYPLNNSIYSSAITELDYTVYDTNLDSCWYSLDAGLINTTITCGNNVTGLNSGEGSSTWQIWANDSDNNINTTTVTFSVDSISPNITELTEYPLDPAIYSQGTTYQFNSTIIDSSDLDVVLFEFNGVNYTATNSSSNFNTIFTDLSVGIYNYRWFANDSVGNFNNSETGTYTISKATPELVLNGTTPITYGIVTDFLGSGCPAGLNCSLDIINNVYAAGNITANYSTSGSANYTSAYANFTITINKAPLVGAITGTSPINYTAIANITANETNNNDSDVVYILYRDNATISIPDNTVLGAGNYYYIYNSTGGQNYSANPSIDTFNLTIDKATGEVYAYVGNLRADYLGNNLTAKNEDLNGSLNIGLGNISMYFNNSLIQFGESPLYDVRDFPLGSYYFNVTYDGDDNYTLAEEHWGINISVWFLSNLTGVFNLNAGNDDIAYDISGNNNNGTIEDATWGNDNIDITLIEDFDYSVNNNSGLFVLLNDARDWTFIEIGYTYFTYDSDFLEGIVVKILPGLLLLLILTMIIRLFMGRTSAPEEVYLYEY